MVDQQQRLSKLSRTNNTSSKRRNESASSNAKANMSDSKNSKEKQETRGCNYDHSFETPLPTRYYAPKPFHGGSRRNNEADSCIHIPTTNPNVLIPDL